MTSRLIIWVILLSGVAASLRAQDAPTSLPTDEPMPPAELAALERAELGSRYVEADAAKYAEAHELIERFFALPAARPQTIRSLETLGVDANDLGRLVRIRRDWPALQPGVYYIDERVGPNPARYFLGVPAGYTRDNAWPLVIELPTADAFVGPSPPDAIGVTQIYQTWMADELKRHGDAVVVMPLLNLDELYGPSYAGMNSVITPLMHVADRVNIDPARVYLLGHSMAAHATWNLSLLYTTYFAAFDAMAGSAGEDWQRVRIMNLRNTFPIIWHDANDAVVPIGQAQALTKLLGIFHVPFDFSPTKGVGHVPTANIVEERYAKMRSHDRPLYPKNVSLRSTRLDAPFTRLDWLKIDQPIKDGGTMRVVPRHGNGVMVICNAPFTLEGAFDQNVVNITATNVDLLRVYLNDQMIDFSRPVTILLNRKMVFEGMLSPSVETMLKDQLILGRGWRYFTVGMDFSTTSPATQSAR